MFKIFRLIFWLRGWKLNPNLPEERNRAVILIAPHTSNWDFIYGLGALDSARMRARFTIKKEWMRFPIGIFMRMLGALGIDRSPSKPGEKAKSMVEAMVHLFETHKELAMGITPEGTRKRVSQWHTGFFYVALHAKVPILLAYVDYGKKESGIGKVIWPDEKKFENQMKEIMEFYSKVTPKFPKNFSLDDRYLT